MQLTEQIKDHFIFEEGYRNKSYRDTEGLWTIGIGHLLGADNQYQNLVWSDEKIHNVFEQDFQEAVKTAKKLALNFDSLPAKTQIGLIDMSFNLGYRRLSKFYQTLKFINEGKLEEAAAQALKSKWARQLPNRSKRVAELLKG
jgi:lysozyme